MNLGTKVESPSPQKKLINKAYSAEQFPKCINGIWFKVFSVAMLFKYNKDLSNQDLKEWNSGDVAEAVFGAVGWNICEKGTNASEPKCSY